MTNAVGSTRLRTGGADAQGGHHDHPAPVEPDGGHRRQAAQFTVAATGDGTLTYQWQKNSVNVTNGGHYAGCTTATLTISTADSSDAASYRCVVTGGCGSATSNAATLTVTPAGQRGDFDHDNDVDLQDFGILQRCLRVSNPAGDPTCGPADLDGNNIIDRQDVTRFVGCMSRRT